MNPRSFAVAAAILMAAASPAAAQTYGFDSLTCGSGAGLGTYQGFTWGGFLCYDATIPTGFPNNLNNGVVSLKNVIYNRGGTGSFIARATSFNLTSAYVTAARSNYPEIYRFRAISGGSQVGFVDVTTGNAAQLVSFNFANIDSVVLANISNPSGNAGVVIDDITFDAPSSSVPEPASVALVASGLVGVAVVGRRRRRR